MRASCSERGLRTPGTRGFTVVELIAVMIVAAALAVVVMPRLGGALSMRHDAWRDTVLAALRTAQATSHGHRRLVCVDFTSTTVSLRLATLNPASACDAVLPGPDGASVWARDAAAGSTSVSPAGTLYFQPDGRVSSDGAGTTLVDRSIVVSGSAAITLSAETGHAR